MHQKRTKLTNVFKSNPLWLALFVQFMAAVCVWQLLWHLPEVRASVHWLWFVVGFQSSIALLLSVLLGLPRWWWWIQGLLPVGLALGLLQTVIPAWAFGVMALLMALVFSNVWRERVPLYLSNAITHQALVHLVEEYQVHSAIDLGSGLGGVVRALGRSGVAAVGVEASPVLSVVSALLSRVMVAGKIVRGDIWQTDISQVDMVYVFLSPVPMPEIWRKACREMKPGALLVSNSFAVPDVEPDDVWELSDARQTQLFIYKIPESACGSENTDFSCS